MTTAWASTGGGAQTTGTGLNTNHNQPVALTASGPGGQLYAVENPANLSPVTDMYGQVQGTFGWGVGKAYAPGQAAAAPSTNGFYNSWTPNQSATTAADHELMS